MAIIHVLQQIVSYTCNVVGLTITVGATVAIAAVVLLDVIDLVSSVVVIVVHISIIKINLRGY